MTIPKDDLRRLLRDGSREELAAAFGQVWDADELDRDFAILGRLGPYVAVRRRTDGQKGNVEGNDHFQFFFNFRPAL